MKRIYHILNMLFFLSLMFAGNVYSQVPQAFNYQGIARDQKGNALSGRTLSLKLSLLPAADAVLPGYEETHSVQTNAFGLYTLQIGKGKALRGNMQTVKWETGNIYIRVAIDVEGNGHYADAGTTQLLSVPYALFAGKAATAGEAEHPKTRSGTVSTSPAGTGTINYLTKFTAANTIYNSLLYDNGSSIGIGTSSPNLQSKLHMLNTSGNIEHIRMQNTDGNAFGKFMLYNDVASNYSTFTKYGSTFPGGYPGISLMYPYANMLAFGNNFGPFLLANNGNVGIGIVTAGNTILKFNAVQSSGYIGMGGNAAPSANVHFNNNLPGDTLRITNATTGHTNNDGLEIGNTGTAAFIMNKEGSALYLGVNSLPSIMALTPAGNAEFSGQIKIGGGLPGPGKILTSDTNGLATWQIPALPADGKTIHHGAGIPAAGTGTDGDFYINTANSFLYGPKTGGNWNDSISLIGPAGATGPAGPTGNDGPTGPQGNNGLNGNTIISGDAAPVALQGNDGDYFIDTIAHNLYGPKTGGAWGNATLLIGPAGPQGMSGVNGNLILSGDTAPSAAQGNDADYFIDTLAHAIYGPKSAGVWGSATSLVGPAGVQGNTGMNGNTILSGDMAPAQPEGNDGDYFIDTVTHTIYGPKTAGAWGNATTLTGPAGPQGNIGLNGNTVLSGAASPLAQDGNDGDYFIDTISHNIYGPKTFGTWGNATALTGPAGPQGNNGVNGNTLLSGAAPPAAPEGNEGDYFIDTISHSIYGPKTGGVWGNASSLTGPAGPQGNNGNTLLSGAAAPMAQDGTDGDYFIDTLAHNIYGPKTLGAWNNPTSLTGPAGPQGATGPAGSDAYLSTTWAGIAALKSQDSLIPGNIYRLSDLYNIELLAKTTNTFHKIPVKRSVPGIEYDQESFDFDTKMLTCIDNIGCTARCVGGAWSVMNDASLEPFKMTTANNHLIVNFGKTYDKVISASTDLDEAYSASNHVIDCGASVTLSTIVLFFYKTTIVNGVLQKTPLTIQEANLAGSNVFIMVKMCKRIQL